MLRFLRFADYNTRTRRDLAPYRDHYSPVPLASDELIASAAMAPTLGFHVLPSAAARDKMA
jgi:hypothetical protein